MKVECKLRSGGDMPTPLPDAINANYLQKRLFPLYLFVSLSTTVAAKMGLFSCSPPLLGKRTWHCHFPIHSEIWP